MLQDSFPSQIPAQGREVFRGDDDGFGGGKAGGRKILVAADGLYFPGVAVEIRHRGSYSHCLSLSGQHAGGLVPPMGDVDDSILSPTPGGSGVAELMFRLYYADFLPDASEAILAAMLWRAIFYYPSW